MDSIRELMAEDHRRCDDSFAAAESAVSAGKDWAKAAHEFSRFRDAMFRHFNAEEAVLFPAFEQRTGMSHGPTQVMRSEHDQIRQLLLAMESAIAAHDAEEYSGDAETLLIMTQQHNMKEENILYPMCDQHLSGDAGHLLAQLGQALAKSGN